MQGGQPIGMARPGGIPDVPEAGAESSAHNHCHAHDQRSAGREPARSRCGGCGRRTGCGRHGGDPADHAERGDRHRGRSLRSGRSVHPQDGQRRASYVLHRHRPPGQHREQGRVPGVGLEVELARPQGEGSGRRQDPLDPGELLPAGHRPQEAGRRGRYQGRSAHRRRRRRGHPGRDLEVLRRQERHPGRRAGQEAARLPGQRRQQGHRGRAQALAEPHAGLGVGQAGQQARSVHHQHQRLRGEARALRRRRGQGEAGRQGRQAGHRPDRPGRQGHPAVPGRRRAARRTARPR